ncbi:hypothetical protein KYJ26_16880 [Bacillus sp. MCCB 382]|uniref:hypothetical protein n=1 Tax=Bacillus sp. MCCB 382 TaxID=2860197 RepID=UPI001C57CD28|nr:hypothetical protein [Bacillus sp. MCCB 382]
MIYCATCDKAIRQQPAVLYDEHTDLTFCSGGCQRDWVDDNFEKVLAYYNRSNLKRIGGE